MHSSTNAIMVRFNRQTVTSIFIWKTSKKIGSKTRPTTTSSCSYLYNDIWKSDIICEALTKIVTEHVSVTNSVKICQKLRTIDWTKESKMDRETDGQTHSETLSESIAAVKDGSFSSASDCCTHPHKLNMLLYHKWCRRL